MIALAAIPLLVALPASAEEIPALAQRLRRDLVRLAQLEFGLDGRDYVSAIAGQIHQESRWNPNAVSPVGAAGLGQFMPGTASWIAQVSPDLGKKAPFDPRWSLAATVDYDRRLYDQIKRFNSECDHWWFVLRSYNGGPGHVLTEQRRASDPGDRMSVGRQCSRSAANCRENLSYPDRILNTWAPIYLAAGWEGKPLCP